MLTTIEAMNDDELQQLRECCSTATTTNCSWAIYEVKNHAATMASIEANKMSEPIYLQIEQPVVSRIKIALEDGLESAQELLAIHDESLGRTTRRNKSIAKYYESQITEFKQLIAIL